MDRNAAKIIICKQSELHQFCINVRINGNIFISFAPLFIIRN